MSYRAYLDKVKESWLAHDSLETQLVKLQQHDMADVLENFDQLREYFATTSYAWLFER